MRLNNEGIKFLFSLEGIATSKYYDSVGVQTIGCGSTVSDIPDIQSWPWNKELSITEVVEIFKKSVTHYEDAVNKALKVEVTQDQFNALVSVCYNIGTGGLARSSFIKRINEGASGQQVYNAIMMWKIPKEIIGRRTKEAVLFRDGVYPSSMRVNWFPVSSTTHKPIYSKGKNIDLGSYLSKMPLEGPTGNDSNKPIPSPSPLPNKPIPDLPSRPKLWESLKKIFGWL